MKHPIPREIARLIKDKQIEQARIKGHIDGLAQAAASMLRIELCKADLDEMTLEAVDESGTEPEAPSKRQSKK